MATQVGGAEARKAEEREFHNAYRKVYEQGGAEYARMISNKKWYSVDRKSRDFVSQWLVANGPGKRVLEYGCGGGSYSFLLAERAAHVVGIDISDESIALCRERAAEQGLSDRATFEVMDCEALQFPPASFDIICEAGVLHHLDLPRVWPQFHRVLAPGGRIICTEALAHNPIFQAYRRLTPHLRTKWETDHILGVREIESARKYFNRIDIQYFHLASLLAVPLRSLPVFPAVLETLEAVDDVLMKIPLVQRQAWMAVFILSEPRTDVVHTGDAHAS
jgi:ubiquinone/menaquinone biosynthesis C-methylase UbiE